MNLLLIVIKVTKHDNEYVYNFGFDYFIWI